MIELRELKLLKKSICRRQEEGIYWLEYQVIDQKRKDKLQKINTMNKFLKKNKLV